MMIQQPRYCDACGTELEVSRRRRYDPITGVETVQARAAICPRWTKPRPRGLTDLRPQWSDHAVWMGGLAWTPLFDESAAVFVADMREGAEAAS